MKLPFLLSTLFLFCFTSKSSGQSAIDSLTKGLNQLSTRDSSRITINASQLSTSGRDANNKPVRTAKDHVKAFVDTLIKSGTRVSPINALKTQYSILHHSDGVFNRKDSLLDTRIIRIEALNRDSLLSIGKISMKELWKRQVKQLFWLSNPTQVIPNNWSESPIKDKSPLFKFTYAEVSDNLTTVPMLMADSMATAWQNSLQGNFSFALKGKYSFNAYALFRKPIQGPLPDFFDFHIGYAGLTPPPDLRGTKESLQRMYASHNVFDSLSGIIQAGLTKVKNLVSNHSIESEIVTAREVLGNHTVDKNYQFTDSTTVADAQKLLEWYNGLMGVISSYQKRLDSLEIYRNRLRGALNNDISYDKLMSMADLPITETGNSISANKMQDMKEPTKLFADTKLSKLSLGRAFPYQSDLTLKNTSIKGIDFRIESSRTVYAASAGLIDYRLNGLLKKDNESKPLSYAMVIYSGYKVAPGLVVGLRYFNGRKNNYAQGISKPILQGTAVEMAYSGKAGALTLELAKNIGPTPFIDDSTALKAQKSFWNMNSRDNMAASARYSLFIKRTRTRIDALYSMQGRYYNAFNTMYVNTQTQKYDIKLSQSFLSGMLRLSAWLRNSEFTPALNGIILQNEVSLTSLNLSFQKPRWPSLTVGYNPFKQTFISDSTVQLSIYQAITLSSVFSYKLGIRPASIFLSFNKLGNNQTGNAGASNNWGNSLNINLDHRIEFNYYVSLLNLSYMSTFGYRQMIAGSSLEINLSKNKFIKAGATINSLNQLGYKAGGNIGMRCGLGARGNVGFDYNLSYLPAPSGKSLVKYNYGNLSIRYILVN